MTQIQENGNIDEIEKFKELERKISLSDNQENGIDNSSIGEIELSLSEEILNDLESPISESIETPGSELTTGTDSEITSSTADKAKNPEIVENSEDIENAEIVENIENAGGVEESENLPQSNLSITDKQTEDTEQPKNDTEAHENEEDQELYVTKIENDVTPLKEISEIESQAVVEDNPPGNDQINNSDSTDSIHIDNQSLNVTETLPEDQEEVSQDENVSDPKHDFDFETKQGDDNFGDFEADDDFGDFNDNNDDFGDFGDFNEGTNDQDFGDFGDFKNQVATQKPEAVSVPEFNVSPSVLPSIDISGSIFEDLSTLMSDKVPDNEFTVTIESFKDQEKRLFDCVNASAVDFIWKKSEFESMLTFATPNLLQLCENVEIERRETIRANLEAAVTRKNEISPEAADLLQRLPDLSFLNNPMHS